MHIYAPITASDSAHSRHGTHTHSLSFDAPSNLLKGFQIFEILRNFCAGVSTYLGYGFGLLRVKSLPGVNPNPPFGLFLDSTGGEVSRLVG